MKKVQAKAFGGFVFLLLAIAAAVFLPAWSFNYWQAWAFLAVFDISVALITLYVAKHDPKLLERRVKAGPTAEKEKNQKIIQAIAQFTFLPVLIIPALDHRFEWSQVPSYASIAGDVLVVLGLFVVFMVFKENTFASATVEVQAGQKVISTGPYAVVRHPMYSGAIVMMLGVPVALGSWWGLLVVIPFVIVIIARLLHEEKFLTQNLPGYTEYRAKVRWHLIPGIF